MTATARGRLRGAPGLSTQRLVWRVGDAPREQTVLVKLAFGHRLKGVRLVGEDGRFATHVDEATGRVFVVPADTSKVCAVSLRLVTDPPLVPRVEVPLEAVVEQAAN